MNKKIDFVQADEGKVRLFLEDDNSYASSNPKLLAKFMRKHNFDGNYFQGSSMDFAREYGFKTNRGAEELLNEAINILKTIKKGKKNQ
jgi:hypothetical protein